MFGVIRSNALHLARQHFLEEELGRRRSLEVLLEVCDKDAAEDTIGNLGRVTHVFECIPYVSAVLPQQDIRRMLGRHNGEFRRIIKDVQASATVSLPKATRAKTGSLWNLENIGAYDAWEYSTGQGVKVAIIDTGAEYTHPEIEGCFESNKGYDFVGNSRDPIDRQGHGTHVSGICAGKEYGVAPGCTLYAVRVLDENGSGSESNVIAGIEWAIKNGMDVANLSLGSPVASSAFENICWYAAEKGLILVAAAGNDGGVHASYPAAFGEPVIAVAASDRDNEHAEFSNIFRTNDVTGPGVGIASAYLNRGYATFSGTSMAAPHVSGSIALALPVAGQGDMYGLVESTAKKIGDGDRDVYGAGLVRADAMVRGGKPGWLDLIKGIVW
ncbi:S8 family peptidase [Candidatus Woesearchaeota archaeon]|nr:S8 family peptidase [Candidatus Woesearchaeota archaeon]